MGRVGAPEVGVSGLSNFVSGKRDLSVICINFPSPFPQKGYSCFRMLKTGCKNPMLVFGDF